VKYIAILFITLLIGVVALTIKYSTKVVTGDAKSIALVESNKEFKEELSKFNQQEEGPAAVNKVDEIVAEKSAVLPGIDQTALPLDIRNYIAKGEPERAFLQYTGIYGSKIELTNLKEFIPPAKWEHEYISRKFNELMDLPSIRTDVVALNMLITSMVAVDELRKEAKQILVESLKDLNAYYQTKREEHADAATLEKIHSQIIVGFSAVVKSGNKQTENGTTIDEAVEIVKTSKNREISRRIASIYLEENPDQEQSFHEAMQAEEIDLSPESAPENPNIQPTYEESSPEN